MKKLISISIVIILFSGFIPADNDIYYQISKNIDLFGRVYKEITLNYVDEVDPEKFMVEGINGMLETLDPYTVFIDESDKGDIDLITTGKYGGIGATVGLRNDKVIIVDLIEGYSAQRQGMFIGDIIKYVDSVAVTAENYNHLGRYMKGKPGTEVKITVEREGEKELHIFNLLREEIVIKNVSYYSFQPSNSGNAFIKLSSFSRTAGEEVKSALIELQKIKPIESIVLDLRGNPGGLLDASIDVCEKFLNSGSLIVSVSGKDTLNKKNYYSKESPIAGKTKLAVLINGGSASASEIVAGAIQDHDRGIIIGEGSFGKGLVQTVIPLSNNSSLKVTTARYYTPSGRGIQKIDYSAQKELLKIDSSKKNKSYFTQNKRVVSEGNGIIPDSTISAKIESMQVTNLIARGMFFKFATKYFNSESINNIDEINDDLVFNKFVDFLADEKFEYNSNSEKLIEELIESAENEGYGEKINSELEKIQSLLYNNKKEEILKYKNEVIFELRNELAARIGGKKGRIEQSLLNDTQFNLAFELLNNDDIYFDLLKLN